jgi:hypothetical protein
MYKAQINDQPDLRPAMGYRIPTRADDALINKVRTISPEWKVKKIGD